MIRPEPFVEALLGAGFRQFSGVPCSYLTGLINAVIDCPAADYVGAPSEGEAVAVAAGAALGGRPGVVMFQNSGLGNAVSPLTSLTAVFRIPLLLITTWRGRPDGPADEPQHGLMGRITPALLDLMGVPWEPLPDEEDRIAPALDRAMEHLRTHETPYALVMGKGAVASLELRPRSNGRPDRPARCDLPDPAEVPPLEQDDVLGAVQRAAGGRDAVLTTTGYTGRALYALDDRPNQLYMVGSMGCASSLGLGLAKALPDRRIVVLDGDGAFLMRMGAVAMIGHERPGNLLHVLLDNGVHDSTGGQATVSSTIDPAAVAAACGYPRVHRPRDMGELERLLVGPADGLTFVHVRTRPRQDRKLPRPHVRPAEVARRFAEWVRTPCPVGTASCDY